MASGHMAGRAWRGRQSGRQRRRDGVALGRTEWRIASGHMAGRAWRGRESGDRKTERRRCIGPHGMANCKWSHGWSSMARTSKAADEDGTTALHSAAWNGKLQVVTWLVEHGADVKAATKDGRTALHWAVENGHKDVVALLEEMGA